MGSDGDGVAQALKSIWAGLLLSGWTVAALAGQTSPTVMEFHFHEACRLDAAAPSLPQGWVVHDATLACGPQGLYLKKTGKDPSLTAPAQLQPGRYLLSAAGAGPVVYVRSSFGTSDAAVQESHKRVLNLESSTPLMNWKAFVWREGGAIAGGVLQVYVGDTAASGLQWLRLERLPETAPPPRVMPPPEPGQAQGWTVGVGTALNTTQRMLRPAKAVQRMVTMRATQREPAQIERTISLPAGRYRLQGWVEGVAVVSLTTGPDALAPHSVLALESLTRPRLDQPFVSTGQPLTLRVQAKGVGYGVHVGELRVLPEIEVTLSPAELRRERPLPWPARGATVDDMFHFLAQPPTDIDGQPCEWVSKRANLAEFKRWGGNVVRMSMALRSRVIQGQGRPGKPPYRGCRLVKDADIDAQGNIRPEAYWGQALPVLLSRATEVLRHAGGLGLKVVVLIDPSGPSAALGQQPGPWLDPRTRAEAVRNVRELARQLAPWRQHIWAYDLFNEPHEYRAGIGNLAPSEWRSLAIEMIQAIREEERLQDPDPAQDSWVVYEPHLIPSTRWRHLDADFVPLPDRRVLYSWHFYDTLGEGIHFTHQNICPTHAQAMHWRGTRRYQGTPASARAALAPLAAWSARTGAPVYIGEFGAASWAGWHEVKPLNAQAPALWAPPARDAQGQPVYDSTLWLRDTLEALEAHQFAWTHHSFRTYWAWDVELIPVHGPCGPHVRWQPGEPETPSMVLLKHYLRKNAP